MGEHWKRKEEIFKGALPEEGTKEYQIVTKRYEQQLIDNPRLKKHFKDSFAKAVQTAVVQNANGISLNMDSELRYFLREFNQRVLEHGIRSMPMMFNIMEAFFNYDKSIIYFELLSEEDYLFSFFDFIDYYTSDDFKEDIASLKDNLIEDLIFNFNVGADINEINFRTENGEKFVIGGISMIRKNNEVTILFQTGLITDTDVETEKLQNQVYEGKATKGREKIIASEEYRLEAVKLNNNKEYWKTLIACRFDIDKQTIDGRYLAKDLGKMYRVTTDEVDGFLRNGEFRSTEFEDIYQRQLLEVDKYNAVFELAKIVLYLPIYFNKYEDDINSEEHFTNYKQMIGSPLKAREFKNVDDKFKISSRTLYILNKNNKFSADRISLRESDFKIDTSGYWKNLNPDEYGIDKKGVRISGKTWVERKESYYEGKTDALIVTDVRKHNFNGPNAGFIYVMRSPYLPVNTFKIGLTTKDPEERAYQLSKTSIPDRHYVMREWNVADCKLAEKQIHELLAPYRVDSRREFFCLDMAVINKTVEDVVNKINDDIK